MCFVEFEDISLAATALYGQALNILELKSLNGGIRLSFAKNPLSVLFSNNDALSGDDPALNLVERPEGADSPSLTANLSPPASVRDNIPQVLSLAEAVPPTDSGYASTNLIGRGYESLKKQDGQAPAPSLEELASDDADDTATQYSNFSSLSFSRSHNLTWELARDLFSRLDLSIANEAMRGRVSAILPEMLKAFALRMGYGAPSQMHRDIRSFVHTNRRSVPYFSLSFWYTWTTNCVMCELTSIYW
jgi:hypothetical protein